MRRALFRVLVVAVIAVGVRTAFAVPTGPVYARTNARGFPNRAPELNCTSGCHTPDAGGIPSGINDASGWIKILGVPTNYAPGAIYPITVRLHHDWNPMPDNPLRWGFQMQAVQASTADSAGSWIFGANVPPDSFKIVKPGSTNVNKNRRYVDQAGYANISVERAGSPTHFGEVGEVEWHLSWQAPPGDSGKIIFFASGNSTNGDDQCFTSGDFVFTTAESTTAGGSVGVGNGFTAHELRAYATPNPMRERADISFATPRGGLVDLAVFDLSGRHVSTLVHDFREAGAYVAPWNGRDVRGNRVGNGIYFVRLTGPDRRTFTSKIVLSR